MKATFDLRLYELNAKLLENWRATFGETSKLKVEIVQDDEDDGGSYNAEFLKKMELAQQQFDNGDFIAFSSTDDLKGYIEELTQSKI
jgi:hypothetical protein